MKNLVAVVVALMLAGAVCAEETPGPVVKSPIEMVVHRGANHIAPENTRAAAQACIDLGVDYVEVDVQMSRDGVFYIMHDRTVNRTTDGEGMLILMNSEKIDQLDAGGWFAPEFKGEPVPRLKEYLEWTKGQAKVYLDVKNGDMKRLIALVYEAGFEEDCFFWFGNDMLLEAFRAADKKLRLKINAYTPEEVAAAVENYGAAIVETQLASLTPAFIAACRERDVKIMIYESEDTADMYRRILESEADMINLNRPELFVEVLRELQKEQTR